MIKRKAKILATMGPAIAKPALLEKVLLAGADAIRLNMSHGTHAEHAANLAMIRKTAHALNRPCAVLADLMGPKIRCEDKEFALASGDEVELVVAKGAAPNQIGISHRNLHALVGAGQRVLLDDGQLELKVLSVHNKKILCRVVHGGRLKPRKSVNVPGIDMQLPILSAKDKADLKFLRKAGVDWLAASFVRHAADINTIKKHLRSLGMDLPVIAKIENVQALENLEGIIEASEGVMVARGDLGVEVNLEVIPALQRKIVLRARQAGKVAIVATQMLESMISNPKPTRAEISDVSTAALERVDALMLSAETAAGRYPVEAVQYMDRTIRAAESGLEEEMVSVAHPEKMAATCASAIYFARLISARAIVALSTYGKTPRILSSFRGNMDVILACTEEDVYQRSALYYSIQGIRVKADKEPSKTFKKLEPVLKKKGLVKKGDVVIYLFGYPFHVRNGTNSVRQLEIG